MAMFADQTALVLFSGGQDSTVCLAWALERFGHVETIGFSYGQRHHVELDCRQEVLRKFRTQFPQWAERLGEDRVIDAGVLKELGDTALTSDAEMTAVATIHKTGYVTNRLPFVSAPIPSSLAVEFQKAHHPQDDDDDEKKEPGVE